MNALMTIGVRIDGAAAKAGADEIVAANKAMVDSTKQAASQMQAAGISGTGMAAGTNEAKTAMEAAKVSGDTFGKSLDAVSSSMSSIGKQGQMVGRQLETTFTVPFVAAGALAVDTALKQAQAFAQLQANYGSFGAQTGNTTQELNLLNQAFTSLSDTLGISKVTLDQVATEYAKAGATGQQLALDTKNSAQLMVITGDTTVATTDKLIGLQEAYKYNADQMNLAIADMVAVTKDAPVTFDKLAEAMRTSAGAAAESGISMRELAALVGSLAPAAGDASTAGNALRTIISRLAVPSKDYNLLLNEMGINTNSVAWQSASATDKLLQMADAMKQLTPAQKSVVDSAASSRFQIDRFSVLISDLQNPLGNYARSMRDTANATDVFNQYTKELQTQLQSSPQAFKILWQQLQNALVQIIVPLLPAIEALIGRIVGLVTAFTNLSPATQQLILLGMAAVAVLGPVIRIASGLLEIAGFAGKLAGYFLDAGGAIVGMFTSTDAAAAGGATAQETAAAATMTAWEESTAAVVSSIETIPAAAASAATGVAAASATMSESILQFAAENMAAVSDLETIWAGGASVVAEEWNAGLAAMQTETPVVAEQLALDLGEMTQQMTLEFETLPASWFGVLETMATETAAVAEQLVLPMDAATQQMALGFGALDVEAAAALAGLDTEVAVAAAAMDAEMAAGMAVMAEEMAVLPEAAAAAVTTTGGLFAALPEAMAGAVASIEALVGGLLTFFSETFAAIAAFIGGLFGPDEVALVVAAVAAVIAVIGGIVYAVVDNFSSIENAVVDLGNWLENIFTSMWNALPQAVQTAINDVINLLSQAAGAIKDGLSYLDPFAHHSPSLVENVQAGTSKINDHYSGLTDPGSGIDQATQAMSSASPDGTQNAAASGPSNSALNQQLATQGAQQAVATQAAKEAKAAYDAQKLSVDALKAALSDSNYQLKQAKDYLTALQQAATNTSQALSNAKTELTNLVSTPITGETAMSNAIFANAQAVKQLQLNILKLQDVNGVYQDLTKEASNYQGELLKLSATQLSLAQRGAGSDILGAYGSQITQIQGQATDIAKRAADIQKLTDQETALQHKGQELSLEQSIIFDPLRRNITAASKDLVEMPYDQLLAKVIATKQQVNDLTGTYHAQQSAVNAQKQVVDNLTVANQALNDQYQKQQQLLAGLKSAATAASAAAKGPALDNMQKDFNAGALDQGVPATGLGGTNLAGLNNPDPNALGNTVSDWAKQAQKAVPKLDIIGMLTKPFADAWDWITRQGGALGDAIGKAFSGAVDWVKGKINTIFGPLGGMFSGVGGGLGNAFAPLTHVLDAVGSAFDSIGSTIKRILQPVITFVQQQVGGLVTWWNAHWDEIRQVVLSVWTIISTVIKYAWGEIQLSLQIGLAVLKAVWGVAWAAIKLVVTVVWDEIKMSVQLAWNVIHTVIKIGMDVLLASWRISWALFKGVISVIWDSIKFIVSTAIDTVKTIIGVVLDIITGKWGKAWSDLRDGVMAVFHDMINFITGIAGTFWTAATGVANAIWNAISSVLSGLWGMVKGAFWTVIDGFGTLGSDLWNGAWNLGKSIIGGVVGALGTIGSDILKAIKDAVEFLPGGTWLWNALGDVIPGLAEGGIVTQPTLALIGEAGPEAVIPLNKISGPRPGMSSSMPLVDGGIMSPGNAMAYATASGKNDRVLTNNQSSSQGESKTMNFYGNLEFPNITSGDDAEKFVKNLESLG